MSPNKRVRGLKDVGNVGRMVHLELSDKTVCGIETRKCCFG